MKKAYRFVVLAAFALAASAHADEPEWLTKSNRHANKILEDIAKFNPEGAGGIGIDGVDEEIIDLGPNVYERGLAASRAILADLESSLETESDRRVRQDLGIMIKAMQDNIASNELQRQHMLPYFNLNQTIFGGVRALIDPQVPRDRYPAAVVRM